MSAQGGGLAALVLGVAGGAGVTAVLLARAAAARAARRSDDSEIEDQDYEVDLVIEEPAPSSMPPAVTTKPAPAPAGAAPVPGRKPGSGPTPAPGMAPRTSPPAPREAPHVPPLPTKHPTGYLTRSTDRRTHVTPSDVHLLEQIRKSTGDATITLDELAGARLAASEYETGSLVELGCIVDAEVNRAARARRSLYESLTAGAGFGRQGQGSRRPASTARDPKFKHLWAARAVLRGPARGIARGAVRFFDPQALDAMHTRWKAGRSTIPTSCDAMSLLEVWSFDRPRLGRTACPFDKKKIGKRTQAWVGAIEGVDPWRLMLMQPEPIGPRHLNAFMAAAAVIDEGRRRTKGR